MSNKNVEFKYAPMFQLGKDDTEYRLISKEGVTTAEFEGKTIVKVAPEALTLLAQQAFHDCEFMLRRAHNEQVAKILTDPEASENSVRIPVQLLYMVRKVSRCGQVSRMKKRYHVVFSTPIPRRTFVTLRMLLSTCMTR